MNETHLRVYAKILGRLANILRNEYKIFRIPDRLCGIYLIRASSAQITVYRSGMLKVLFIPFSFSLKIFGLPQGLFQKLSRFLTSGALESRGLHVGFSGEQIEF